jgi:dihydropteroate synthase
MLESWLQQLRDPHCPPSVMGILNVTPDSFSDGGRHLAVDAALARAAAMVEEGANIIDVGGESTRPGAQAVSDEEQCRRVLPVLEALRKQLPAHVVLSIDTRSSTVAVAALSAGAHLINDVSGGRDPRLLQLAARESAALVLMHMQGKPDSMQIAPTYQDVVAEVLAGILAAARTAEAAGVARDSILIDPGIGFGKTREHNLRLLAGLPQFVATGYPVLLGTSRKRFMGAICRETSPTDLVGATCATTALGVAAGVRVFRVHDVRPNRQAAEVAWAIGATAG